MSDIGNLQDVADDEEAEGSGGDEVYVGQLSIRENSVEVSMASEREIAMIKAANAPEAESSNEAGDTVDGKEGKDLDSALEPPTNEDAEVLEDQGTPRPEDSGQGADSTNRDGNEASEERNLLASNEVEKEGSAAEEPTVDHEADSTNEAGEQVTGEPIVLDAELNQGSVESYSCPVDEVEKETLSQPTIEVTRATPEELEDHDPLDDALEELAVKMVTDVISESVEKVAKETREETEEATEETTEVVEPSNDVAQNLNSNEAKTIDDSALNEQASELLESATSHNSEGEKATPEPEMKTATMDMEIVSQEVEFDYGDSEADGGGGGDFHHVVNEDTAEALQTATVEQPVSQVEPEERGSDVQWSEVDEGAPITTGEEKATAAEEEGKTTALRVRALCLPMESSIDDEESLVQVAQEEDVGVSVEDDGGNEEAGEQAGEELEADVQAEPVAAEQSIHFPEVDAVTVEEEMTVQIAEAEDEEDAEEDADEITVKEGGETSASAPAEQGEEDEEYMSVASDLAHEEMEENEMEIHVSEENDNDEEIVSPENNKEDVVPPEDDVPPEDNKADEASIEQQNIPKIDIPDGDLDESKAEAEDAENGGGEERSRSASTDSESQVQDCPTRASTSTSHLLCLIVQLLINMPASMRIHVHETNRNSDRCMMLQSNSFQMGNLFSQPRRGGGGGGGGDLFSDVRHELVSIQKSKSQSDIAVQMKLQKEDAMIKSKFLKSRDASLDKASNRKISSSASVSVMPWMMAAAAAAQERSGRKGGKRKASKSEERKRRLTQEIMKKKEIIAAKVEEAEARGKEAEETKIVTADVEKKQGEEEEGEPEVVEFRPKGRNVPNPPADKPKKLDEIFGAMRTSEPVPQVINFLQQTICV